MRTIPKVLAPASILGIWLPANKNKNIPFGTTTASARKRILVGVDYHIDARSLAAAAETVTDFI